MRRGTNVLRLADFNQRVVLDTIRQADGGISRVEIGHLTGLSRQTISNIARRLIDDGLVRECAPVPATRGKPRTPLTLVADACFALGIHLDPARLTFVMLDQADHVVADTRLPMPAGLAPARAIDLIAETSLGLVQQAGVDPGRVLGLGLAAPGPVDVRAGVLLDPPQLPGWHAAPLRAALRRATGLRVLLDKDVSAAATAELRAAPGRHDFLLVYLGAGVGVGVVLSDAVVRGATNNLGEVGELLVDPAAEDLGWGRPGSLATACLPQALVAQARQRGILATPPDAGYVEWDAGFTRLCELAGAGHAEAGELIDRSARRLATGLCDVVNLLDVERVVLGGPAWSRISSRHLATLPGLMEQGLAGRRVVTVEGSAVGEDLAAHGAAMLVLDHELAPQPATLLLE